MNYLEAFTKLDVYGRDYLCGEQILEFCERCFLHTLDSRLVEEAVVRICGHNRCTAEHLRDVISEVAKMIQIENNIRWEFEFLDKEGAGRISLSDSLFLFKAIKGNSFSLAGWQLFLSQRPDSKSDYVSYDELAQALLSDSHNSGDRLATSFDDYMNNKHELSRLTCERNQAVYSGLQKLVAEISSSSGDEVLDHIPDDSEAIATSTIHSNVSLINKAAERLNDIKKNGLNAFHFEPPREDFVDHPLHVDENFTNNATVVIDAVSVTKEQDESSSHIALDQSEDLTKLEELRSTINTVALSKHKCLAEKLLADLVVCNHADVPRIESLQNDYSQLLSQLPDDLRQVKEFSVDSKWIKALEKLFTHCDVHIYCLALIEADSKLLEIFDGKLTNTEKFAMLVQWLGRGCSQELTTVENFLSQNTDFASVQKFLLQSCLVKSAVQWEADFASALIMSKLLSLSLKELAFIHQHKESSTLGLLHMLLASARISAGSFANALAVSLCPVRDALSKQTTEYLQNMVLEIATQKDYMISQDLIRLLKSKSFHHSLKICSNYSVDSALLKYKELKELSKMKPISYSDTDITGIEEWMEGLALRCYLLLTHMQKSTGTGCVQDVLIRILADLQKLQVHNTFGLLEKICQEDQLNFSGIAETALSQHNFVSLVVQVVFPSNDFLSEQFYDTSVYTEVVMGIKSLYMCYFRCLFWHNFETSGVKIKFMSSLNRQRLLFFIMEKMNCLKTSKTSGLDAILPGPIKDCLITNYYEFLKHFCSERVVTLGELLVSVHSKHEGYMTMQALINGFYASAKGKCVPLQVSEAYRSMAQCLELEISLFHSAEKFKGHVTLSSELGTSLVVALCHTQYQEICKEVDPNIALCLMAQGLHLRHFDGSVYKCEAPLLQCFLAHRLLAKPLETARNSASLDNEVEPLTFSSCVRVSKYKALLSTFKEQSFQCINLLRSVLLYIKCDQSSCVDATVQLNQVLFHATELYYQKTLTSQIKELIGDQIYYHCLLARKNYGISSPDEKWIVLFDLLTLLDQKHWNLFAFVTSKATTKEVDTILKRLTKHSHQVNGLLFMLCQTPVSYCNVFHYLEVIKSHVISVLHSKYNVILSKLQHLSKKGVQATKTLLVQTGWLAQFWLMHKSGKFASLAVSGSSEVPLSHPWKWPSNAKGYEGSEKLTRSVKEIATIISEAFSLELQRIMKQGNLTNQTDHDKVVLFRSQILRIYWEQLYLKNMPCFESALILLSVLNSWQNAEVECKSELQELATIKVENCNFTTEDAATASRNMSQLIAYLEKSVRVAKKSSMSTDDIASFGDFFLHIPEAIVTEMVKKHRLEEEVFFFLFDTIYKAQIIGLTPEDDAVEKLKLDRQQWRLSAEVVGAETQDFTSTITGVLILDEQLIKKREVHIKLLQDALMIILANAWKQQTEQDIGFENFLKNKMADLLAHLIQVQVDEAYGIIGKLSRITAKSQKVLYNERRVALIQCWLDNIAAVLLGIDPVQNRLMSKTMRLNLQQGDKKLQKKKDRSVKARQSITRVKRRASLSPYVSEEEHGSTSSLLSALEEETPQQELKHSLPELSFQAQLKMMAEIEKEFQSEKMKILLQLEEQRHKMEGKSLQSPAKQQPRPTLLTAGNMTEGAQQHLRDRVKSAGALKMKERMKERKRQKLARMETQLDYTYGSADEAHEETPKPTSTDETITKLSQLEKVYEEKKKVVLSSIQ